MNNEVHMMTSGQLEQLEERINRDLRDTVVRLRGLLKQANEARLDDYDDCFSCGFSPGWIEGKVVDNHATDCKLAEEVYNETSR